MAAGVHVLHFTPFGGWPEAQAVATNFPPDLMAAVLDMIAEPVTAQSGHDEDGDPWDEADGDGSSMAFLEDDTLFGVAAEDERLETTDNQAVWRQDLVQQVPLYGVMAGRRA